MQYTSYRFVSLDPAAFKDTRPTTEVPQLTAACLPACTSHQRSTHRSHARTPRAASPPRSAPTRSSSAEGVRAPNATSLFAAPPHTRRPRLSRHPSASLHLPQPPVKARAKIRGSSLCPSFQSDLVPLQKTILPGSQIWVDFVRKRTWHRSFWARLLPIAQYMAAHFSQIHPIYTCFW